MIKKQLILLSLCLFSLSGFAGIGHLLPKPQSVKKNGQKFYIDKANVNGLETANWTDYMNTIGLKVEQSARKEITVSLVDDLPNIPLNKEEAYRLSVTSRKIEIQAIYQQRCVLGYADSSAADCKGEK